LFFLEKHFSPSKSALLWLLVYRSKEVGEICFCASFPSYLYFVEVGNGRRKEGKGNQKIIKIPRG